MTTRQLFVMLGLTVAVTFFYLAAHILVDRSRLRWIDRDTGAPCVVVDADVRCEP